MKILLNQFVALAFVLFAMAPATARTIGYLITYETFVGADGRNAWRCTYNLAEYNASAERRVVVLAQMCPSRIAFD